MKNGINFKKNREEINETGKRIMFYNALKSIKLTMDEIKIEDLDSELKELKEKLSLLKHLEL